MKRRPTAASLAQDTYVLGFLSASAVLVLAWSYPLWGPAWNASCLLRELTSIPCPTCYGTRALLAVAAGRWSEALAYNPLVATGGIGLFVYLPWAGAVVVGGWRRPSFSSAAAVRAAWLGAALTLMNWGYLIVAHR